MTRRDVTRRPLRHGVVATLALTALLATPTGPAMAADAGDGLWYYTQTGVAEAHQRTRGEGITIAVLDGPINAGAPELAGADLTVHEPAYCARTPGGPPIDAITTDPEAFHATTVTSMILGNGKGAAGQPGTLGVAPGAHVLHYTVHFSTGGENSDCARVGESTATSVVSALDQAVADGADIVSLSFGYGSTADVTDALARVLRAGVVVVAGVPNDSFQPDFLSSANGVVAVERSDVDGRSATDTMEATPWITVAAPGQDVRVIMPTWDSYGLAGGSSYATPFTAGVLALVWSAYPDATANQMIQSLIRNTGPTDHELTRNADLGYGIVDVQHMLAHDPTTYPDENPLLRDDAEPSTATILGQPEPGTDTTTAPPAEAQDTATPTTTASPLSPLLLTAAGALGLLVLIGIALAVALTRRARRRTTASSSPPPTPGPWA
ncbi:S8 family peptidase [Cellulomonas sp. P22]|uniref:S8 family peptidase n=1 Tax=Cellulomonas sp. P22 TaxID=3373189 RepID=UPI00378BCEAB